MRNWRFSQHGCWKFESSGSSLYLTSRSQDRLWWLWQKKWHWDRVSLRLLWITRVSIIPHTHQILSITDFAYHLCNFQRRVINTLQLQGSWNTLNTEAACSSETRVTIYQSLLYCSNSCTSLYIRTLKSHTKTLKIRPYMFRSPLKPSSGGSMAVLR